MFPRFVRFFLILSSFVMFCLLSSIFLGMYIKIAQPSAKNQSSTIMRQLATTVLHFFQAAQAVISDFGSCMGNAASAFSMKSMATLLEAFDPWNCWSEICG